LGTVSELRAPAGWGTDEDGWIYRPRRPGDSINPPRHGFITGPNVFCKFAKDAQAYDRARP